MVKKLLYNDFRNVHTNRERRVKYDKEAENLLPLMMIDEAKKQTQLYTNLRSIKRVLSDMMKGIRNPISG
jgi:hypothetical protein